MACRIGAALLEGLGRAADHDGERGIARPLDPAADRAVEKLHAARAQQVGGLAGALRADGGAVEHQGAAAQGGRQRARHLEHVRVGGHARDDGLHGGAELGERRVGA